VNRAGYGDGKRLITEVNATVGLPSIARMAGLVVGSRLIAHPGGAYGGAVSIAAGIERRYGVAACERTARYALALLARLGIIEGVCCAGPLGCVGGKADGEHWHARTYRAGWRVKAAARAHRLGRFFLRSKGAHTYRAEESTRLLNGKEEESCGPLTGLTAAAVTHSPPLPPPEAGAPPGGLTTGPPGRYAKLAAATSPDLFDH
jgi:hypothetical protein